MVLSKLLKTIIDQTALLSYWPLRRTSRTSLPIKWVSDELLLPLTAPWIKLNIWIRVISNQRMQISFVSTQHCWRWTKSCGRDASTEQTNYLLFQLNYQNTNLLQEWIEDMDTGMDCFNCPLDAHFPLFLNETLEEKFSVESSPYTYSKAKLKMLVTKFKLRKEVTRFHFYFGQSIELCLTILSEMSEEQDARHSLLGRLRLLHRISKHSTCS